jgi:hypothetical protein
MVVIDKDKTNMQISLNIIKSDYFTSDISEIKVDDDFDCIISAVKTTIRNAEYFLKKLEEKI